MPPKNWLVKGCRLPNRAGVDALVTESGCVVSQQPPLFALVNDQHAVQVHNTRPWVLVTATLADAIALRAFNLVAAPVTGLGELNGEGVRLLGRHFGVERVLSEWQYQEQEAQAIAAP